MIVVGILAACLIAIYLVVGLLAFVYFGLEARRVLRARREQGRRP